MFAKVVFSLVSGDMPFSFSPTGNCVLLVLLEHL